MTTSFVWRPRAKMVAVVDLSLSAINLVIVVIVAILASIAVAVINIVVDAVEKENSKQKSASGEAEEGAGSNTGTPPTHTAQWSAWILWVGVAVHIVIAVLYLWAGYKLLKSTDLRKTTKEALSGSRVWFYLSVLLLLITTPLNIVIFEMYVTTGIGFVVRVALMFVVYQFMEELKVAINATNISQVAPI